MTNHNVNTKSEISRLSASARQDRRNLFQKVTQPFVDLLYLPKIISKFHSHLQSQHEALEFMQLQIELLEQQLAATESELDCAVTTLADRNADLRSDTERFVTQLEQQIELHGAPGRLDDLLDTLSIKTDKRLTALENATEEFEDRVDNLEDCSPTADDIRAAIEECVSDAIADNAELELVVGDLINSSLDAWHNAHDIADEVENVIDFNGLFTDFMASVDVNDFIDFKEAAREIQQHLSGNAIQDSGFITAAQCLELIAEQTETTSDIDDCIAAVVDGFVESDAHKELLDETIASHIAAYDSSLAEAGWLHDAMTEFVINNQFEVAGVITECSDFETSVQAEVKAQIQILLKSLFQATVE